ncbi:MAG: membrane protein [Parcubacteria group bacterium Gr01-1014_70]|nr:MAG: membrane protein [Parcubacteria group bacterium Gr01-1014_70]
MIHLYHMDGIAFIISFVLLLMVLSLKKRVQHLQNLIVSRGIASQKEVLGSALSAEGFASTTPQISEQAEQPLTPRSDIPEKQNPFEAFAEWAREDWLMKLGALLLLIGFGWLVRYAFLNNWIGPAGRITLGVAAGVVFLIVGWWRIQRFINQGSVFLALGSGVVLLSIFAARFLYDFFTPLSAMAIMFLSVVFVALASVKFQVRSLSLVSLALAGVVPILTHSPTSDYIGLFTYLLVVVVGATWIVALTGWRVLTPASLVLVTIYSMQHLIGFVTTDKDVLLLFAYAFTGVFFLTNVIGSVRSSKEDPLTDALTAGGVGLFLLVWIMQTAPSEWQSLLLVSWMIVFSMGAFLVFRATQKRVPFFAYAAVSIALLAAATAAELDGPMLTIAYTLESACISLVLYAALRDVKIALMSTFLLAAPAALSIESFMARVWRTHILHDHFFVLLLFAGVLLGLGLFFTAHLRKKELPGGNELYAMSSALLIAGSFYAYALLWLSLHAAFQNDDMAVMLSLAVYTIIGILCYFYRGEEHGKYVQGYGGVLLGFVVGRLLIVDVWNMALTGRIITFFLIGILLMSTAFLWKKQSNDTTFISHN